MGGGPDVGGRSRRWGEVQTLEGGPGVGGRSRHWREVQALEGGPGVGGSWRLRTTRKAEHTTTCSSTRLRSFGQTGGSLAGTTNRRQVAALASVPLDRMDEAWLEQQATGRALASVPLDRMDGAWLELPTGSRPPLVHSLCRLVCCCLAGRHQQQVSATDVEPPHTHGVWEHQNQQLSGLLAQKTEDNCFVRPPKPLDDCAGAAS